MISSLVLDDFKFRKIVLLSKRRSIPLSLCVNITAIDKSDIWFTKISQLNLKKILFLFPVYKIILTYVKNILFLFSVDFELRSLLPVNEGSDAVQHLQQGHVLQLQVQVRTIRLIIFQFLLIWHIYLFERAKFNIQPKVHGLRSLRIHLCWIRKLFK